MMESGQSLIHGDLHFHNISCQNASENQDWKIRLVDWESAKYAPGWFDLVVLVEILIDFRKDWQNDADDIRKHCTHLYTEEMKKHGITFQTDALQLLKMTYLQRTLEKRLLNHLRRVLRGEKSILLERYLEKTTAWGKELGLY
jgi:aminoglycoside phosphotransferase (APT) family kinase protein